MPNWAQWGRIATISAATVALAGAAAGCAETESSTNSSSKSKSKQENCGKTATDDCTPRLAAGKQLRVDAIYYKVLDARTASELGDQQYGLGAKADGAFVIVKLRVRSDKDESATLTGQGMQLAVGKNTYDPDSEGTVAAMGANEEPFFLKDIGPDTVTTGTVVYDVPKKVLSKKLEMRFAELGLGSTHGYIRLPTLSS